jgi:imidazolonepropionase-like amidohydrolase
METRFRPALPLPSPASRTKCGSVVARRTLLAMALLAALRRGDDAAAALLATPAFDGSLLIRHARLIDGSGAPPRDDVAILVRAGRIAAIGPDDEVAATAAADTRVLDAAGATVVPGLIDAHVHLDAVTGAELRDDPPERRAALRRRQLRSYLACGVTTVLDTGIQLEELAEIRGWLAAGEPGPSFLTLGPPIAPRGGYMSSARPDLAVARVEDLERSFAAIDAADTFGVKVPIERGFGVDVLPIHPPAVRAAIVEHARARGLPVLVHASDEAEQTIALDMGAYALVHTNFGGRDPSPAFVDRMAATRTYTITTFSIIDADLARFDLKRLDDPLTRTAVPAEELASAQDRGSWLTADAINLGHPFPWLPAFARRFLARALESETGLRRVLEVNLRAARTLHDRGVPVVIGSDAGNAVLAQFHGTSTLREIELLASTGIPPTEALAAATSLPARMLHLEDEVGTVAVGKRADLVIVRDDPLEDVRALRSILWTVKSGVARTPAEWMDEAAPH